MKKTMRNGIAALGSLLFVFACNGQTLDRQDTIGSETNWLGDCSRTGRCAEGECLCGICTARCAGDDACRGDDTICASHDGLLFQSTCGDADLEGSGVCVGTCAGDGDCEEDMECVGGLCAARLDIDATPSAGSTPRSRSYFLDQIQFRGPHEALLGRCLPRELPIDDEGNVNCLVLEAGVGSACDCSAPGRRLASPGVARVALEQLELAAVCRGAECDNACACEVVQEPSACLDTSDPQPDGWCYVDEAQGIGDPSIVSVCKTGEKRLVAFESMLEASMFVIACATDVPSPAVFPPENAGLGEACIPAEEYNPRFAGFSVNENTVDLDTPACESGVCLAAHFQGRVSCPYGNGADFLPDDDCETPDGALVTAPVNAQLIARPPSHAVYCSCRCDGPPSSGPFCECPDGFSCEPVFQSVPGLGLGDVAGSYCIKDGTYVPDPIMLEVTEPCRDGLCDDR